MNTTLLDVAGGWVMGGHCRGAAITVRSKQPATGAEEMNTLSEVVADALPELPKPALVDFDHVETEQIEWYYTADQMREYARAALALPTPEASAGVEERARELLAAEYERIGMEGAAAALRRGDNGMDYTIAAAFDAVCAALRTPAKTEGDVGRVFDAAINAALKDGAGVFRIEHVDAEHVRLALTTPPAQQEALAVGDAITETLEQITQARFTLNDERLPEDVLNFLRTLGEKTWI